MLKKISEETMEYVSILAKLDLSEEEKKQSARDMETILMYVDMLEELDTDGVEPMTHLFSQENRFRFDEVTSGEERESMLSGAPVRKGDYYQVPKTVE